VLPAELPPALGAGLLALQMLGIPTDGALLDNLAQSVRQAGK
jgi:hypothetical protein